jgi:hypothetical protein
LHGARPNQTCAKNPEAPQSHSNNITVYQSSKYYPAGDSELKERMIYANGKRNETFEGIYDMSDDKQGLLEATWQIVNGPLSAKKAPWYYEVAIHIEKNMKLRKE